jgi:hypothetical protein
LQSFNYAQLTTERSAPVEFASWTPYASLPLTYNPVPDIAWAQGAFDLERLGTA